MGLLREKNISVAKANGYEFDKVVRCKKYLDEIGSNRRNFDIVRLVNMYNDIKGTKEKAAGCKPCQATKFYNGLQNYYYYGRLTLINNGKCSDEDIQRGYIDEKVSGEPLEALKVDEGADTKVEEKEAAGEDIVKPKMTVEERMSKARAARKKKKEASNEEEEG